jgi:pimeloyl-ACP methyl ester carboxylesterase
MRLRRGAALVAAAALALAGDRPANAYDYTVDDPLLATVIGTRAQDKPALPSRVPSRSQRIERVDDRPIPRTFWDQARHRYSVALQRGHAPLVFLLAGTGSRYSSAKMTFLEALLFGAGFHVVALSSTTHPDFILTAARQPMPGYMPADLDDLSALMTRIRTALEADDVEIDSFSLCGFSLGGTQAAFLAERDAREKGFGFRRVLLINPSVSLYESSAILDHMFEGALPGGPASTDRLITDLLKRLTPYFHNRTRGRVDDEFLYHIADAEQPTEAELRAIIGAVFRMSLANMVFTADVMTGGGHVVERGKTLNVGSSLTQFMKRSTRWTFHRYVDEMLFPYWRERVPGLTRELLVRSASLETIVPFLAAAAHVGVVTNADDFILTPANLELIRRTFGDRARVYPRGGHGGNLEYADNAADIVEFFRAAKESKAQ